MATERQIAANRRNAQNSTGPRSAGGKQRASRNALRHGLAAPPALDGKIARGLGQLARKFLAGAGDVVALAHAHSAADASLDLARARYLKVALIERVATMEDPNPSPAVDLVARTWQHLKAAESTRAAGVTVSKLHDPSPPLPESQIDHYAEALRRTLPDLMKLDRYERRAISRRIRALKKLTSSD